MEVYILDSLLRRIEVVDKFASLIWTERFSSVGDFELILPSNRANRQLFTDGTQLALNESYRCMTVETIENTTDTDGTELLKVTGHSFENMLDSRVAKDALADLTTAPTWNLTGTPGNIARQIFHDICVTGVLDPGDVIPFIQTGTIFPEDTIVEPADVITVNLEPATVYAAIKQLCDLYDLGFRLVRNFDASQLYFDIYAGNDRTTFQSTLAPVVFAPNLDNLQKATEFTTIEKAKNVAYVFSPAGYAVVYPTNVDPDVAGFERRVLLVRADDITADNPDVNAALVQRGNEELSKARKFSAFDGELSTYSAYKYGTDYQVGDIVEVRNSDGAISNMRVTEQIFVSDKEGDRSYPTLTMRNFINPGSWLTWPYSEVWMDYDADLTTTWSTLP